MEVVWCLPDRQCILTFVKCATGSRGSVELCLQRKLHPPVRPLTHIHTMWLVWRIFGGGGGGGGAGLLVPRLGRLEWLTRSQSASCGSRMVSTGSTMHTNVCKVCYRK